MVIEAKRKEMERFKRMTVYRVVTRESVERDEEEKMISIKWVITDRLWSQLSFQMRVRSLGRWLEVSIRVVEDVFSM